MSVEPRRVYLCKVIPPLKGHQDCVNAMCCESGIVVFCTQQQKWWPMEDVVGDLIVWQPNHVIKFRPYENRHVDHLRDTIALQQLLDLFAVESKEEGDPDAEVQMMLNTARMWIDYEPCSTPTHLIEAEELVEA